MPIFLFWEMPRNAWLPGRKVVFLVCGEKNPLTEVALVVQVFQHYTGKGSFKIAAASGKRQGGFSLRTSILEKQCSLFPCCRDAAQDDCLKSRRVV
jgi:hypothetical protein